MQSCCMSFRRVVAILLVAIATRASGLPVVDGAKTVTLVAPYEVVVEKPGTGMDALRLTALFGIDAVRLSLTGQDTQTLSLFGRDDLVARVSADYTPTGCRPLKGLASPDAEILKRARATSIVIINESHERTEHRGFTARLLPALRAAGYSMLAMEAFNNPGADAPAALQPSFVRRSSLPYLEDADGYYLGEAGFGRLGRTAKSLGYAFLPYDERPMAADAAMPIRDQIAQREEAQASALAAWILANPGRKLLVHVGYTHATEVPRADSGRWMAARLKERTGIDPLTISQTTCRGGGNQPRLAALPSTEPMGAFDLVLDHPNARFVRGRPAWRMAAGDMPVSIPSGLRPTQGWRVIEARPEGESDASIPMDRVAVRAGEDVALMLPPGRFRLRVIDPMIARN